MQQFDIIVPFKHSIITVQIINSIYLSLHLLNIFTPDTSMRWLVPLG